MGDFWPMSRCKNNDLTMPTTLKMIRVLEYAWQHLLFAAELITVAQTVQKLQKF